MSAILIALNFELVVTVGIFFNKLWLTFFEQTVTLPSLLLSVQNRRHLFCSRNLAAPRNRQCLQQSPWISPQDSSGLWCYFITEPTPAAIVMCHKINANCDKQLGFFFAPQWQYYKCGEKVWKLTQVCDGKTVKNVVAITASTLNYKSLVKVRMESVWITCLFLCKISTRFV